MLTVFFHEVKENLRTFLIWSLTIGLLGLFCIMLYSSMSEDMANLSESFSNMGAFSDAFGMSTLGIGTLLGYFATEIGTIHGLGGGLFAAILATVILSKEEDGHTGEFLFSLPLSRGKIIATKMLSILTILLGFTLICGALYIIGFEFLGESVPMKDFVRFLAMEYLMNVEIASVCFAFSAFQRKNKLGAGLGIALIFYIYDLIGRVVPDMKEYLFIGPYSYSNASDIFSGGDVSKKAIFVAAFAILLSISAAFVAYGKKDLAS